MGVKYVVNNQKGGGEKPQSQDNAGAISTQKLNRTSQSYREAEERTECHPLCVSEERRTNSTKLCIFAYIYMRTVVFLLNKWSSEEREKTRGVL